MSTSVRQKRRSRKLIDSPHTVKMKVHSAEYCIECVMR